MHRIFKKHWEIFVQRAFNSKDAVKNFYTEINKFQRNKDLNDGNILHRFPKKELRYFLRAECPTERPPEKKAVKSYEVIKSAKRLRYFMGISENFVCTRCSKRDTCKFRDTLPKTKETSISDLLIVMNGAYDYRNQLYSGVEEQKDENTPENEEIEEENVPEIPENQPQDRYIYKTYDSAIKLIDTLYPVVDDLNMRRGYGSKQYINTYIEENKNLHKNRVNFDESDQEDDIPQNNNNRRSSPSSFNKNQNQNQHQRKQFNKDKEELSWGEKPRRSFDNNRSESFRKNQHQGEKKFDTERSPRRGDNIEFREKKKFNAESHIDFRENKKFNNPAPQKRSQEDDADFTPKKRDFSSKKNRPATSFDNDFSDEEDSFVIPKRRGIQTQREDDGDEMFSIKKNKFTQNENQERPAGGRKIKRNKAESFEGKLNLDSFMHNVK